MKNFDFLNKDDMMSCCQLNSVVLQEIQNRYSQKYIGVLYGSFMKTHDNQIKLIEFNCRFGDSEVFNVLNNIETDLTSIFKSMADNTLRSLELVLNIELVNFCEYDTKISKCFEYIHNEPSIKNLGDITKIDIKEYYEKLKNLK